MRGYTTYGDQFFFERVLRFFGMALVLAFRGLIYFPLLLTGYLIAARILDKKANGLAWFGLILLFAVALYVLLYVLKGLLITLKKYQNWIWVPLFLLCVSFTCLLPVWVSFDLIEKFAEALSKSSADVIAWIISAALAIFIYSRYHFLTDWCPNFIFPFYKLGGQLGEKLISGKR